MSQRTIDNRGYGGRFTHLNGQFGYEYYDKYGNPYASLSDARDGYNQLHAQEVNDSKQTDPFYTELANLLGMSVDNVSALVGRLGGDGNLNKKDLLNMIIQQKVAERSFDLSNGSARYSQLLSMGFSRQAALAALQGGSISSAPLGADFASLDQQQDIAQQQNMIAAQDATTNRQNAVTNAYNAYMQNYETRFLQEGRDLLEPIAGAVYGWLLDHEGDPLYVVPDDAKRSPEKFKRWMLAKDENGNYFRPDAVQLMKSDAWDKMSHSLAGVSAFRKEFADNIEGRAPHEMEFDARHARLQRVAQTAIMNCNRVVAEGDMMQSTFQQYVWGFNSGLNVRTDEDGAVSVSPASTDSPWYDIFYNSDGTLNENLPLLFKGMSTDLQTRMQDALEYDGFNEVKWNALREDAELRKNYAALYALIYGDMKDTFEQLKHDNPQLAGQLFNLQVLYQELFGSIKNRDTFEGSFSAHTARINANSAAQNAETNSQSLVETIQHNRTTEQVDIYNAETARLKQGSRSFLGISVTPASGFGSQGETITTPTMVVEDGQVKTQYNLSRLPKRGQ